MKIQSKEIQIVDIQSVKPNPRNRNKHTKEQIARLCDIIKYQGFRAPLIISNRTGLLVSGHGRIEVAKKLGMKQVPVIFQDFESEEQEIAAGVSDNAIAAWSELDLEGINLDIGELGPEFDIDLLGIKGFEIDVADKEGLTDPDEIPETPKESPVCRGELFRLGSHRLLCGDSTSITDVERLMNGEKADMVFTDPPYGMHLDTDFSSMDGVKRDGSKFLKGSKGGKVHKPVIGDNNDFSPELINCIFASFSDARDMFLFGADYYAELLPNKNNGSWVVWDKRTNDGASESQADSADKLFGSNFELVWSKAKHKREIARVRNGIFGVKNEAGNSKTVHPTQKPIQLIEWFFERWGKDNDAVIDLFLGSGSTLIACEKTNRRCYGIEIDPHYCSVILDRWAAFTGKDPVRLNDDGTETPWSEIKATLKSSLLA